MFFACFWWWCMLGKNKYCSWKMNSLRLYRISGNLHGIILPQFQIPNWASIGFMRERGKGGCGQWKPLQSGGLCFKRAARREWKPIDGEDGDEPLCFQREEETLSDQLPACLRTQWQENLAASFQIPKSTLSPPATRSNEHWPLNNLITQCQLFFWLWRSCCKATSIFKSNWYTSTAFTVTLCRPWQNILI